ncbi:MAG: 2-amino-4-hydroxy-6-hydroxymethyldihydropteridine diphosphokinase [Dysgonamonadaceae bacterium]|jgi:2-amino-4-hydroxy-6-hydroxymethyldihydropteridine diphosphokinase|nr:2-amino-4-hydroxy-6-hydroxymethyldihydropteridine diphosphokinase [Dysgonamonadaceae bacterium]
MRCFLSLGTNLGNKQKNLQTAIRHITKKVGKVVAKSSVIETEPWGFNSENMFLNMVVEVETILPPLDVLTDTQKIEKLMGRIEKTHNTYQDRIIDIDIILYEGVVLDIPELKLPHPLFRQRDFVLKPLCEIAPEYF